MFEEMMRYGATLEELCEEAGITIEELLVPKFKQRKEKK